MTLLVLCALREELPEKLPGVTVEFTGVGKVQAALHAAQAIQAHRPALVINYGTAGSLKRELKGLYEIGRVLQRDMAAMPLAPRGQTPFSREAHLLHSGQDGLLCGTGDSFVHGVDPWLVERQVDVVDMELFAVAYACQKAGVKWRSFKYVSDYTDESAANDWQENVDRGQEAFAQTLKRL